MQNQKNYIGFVNDHSGSMNGIHRAAATDYNANIDAVKTAATREMLDTVVSVVGVGFPRGYDVTRQVQISNPHVLKPVTDWPTEGGTPLYDGIASMINLLKDLPDANDSNVSFLIMITTDGEESHSRVYGSNSLKELIGSVSETGRWTFVFRVPRNASLSKITSLGIPLDNIQQWDTTSEGMAKSTAQTTQAVNTYYTARASGQKSSSSFYANATTVDTSSLKEITKDVSLYVVGDHQSGIEIKDFILTKRMQYLKGAAFYQLTKTEARVGHKKQFAVRHRSTGKIYAGPEVRTMLGLPTNANARLHPGDHANYDIFIQSESTNRKLVGGTGVVYWEAIGVPFTEQDEAYLKPKADNGIVQLPAVPVSNTPTKSPIPVQKKAPVVTPHAFRTREEARQYCRQHGLSHTTITYEQGESSPWTVTL